MSLLAWCQWLEHTSWVTAVSESIWLFPMIEGSHILALPLSVGMILMFDLRLLGLAFRTGLAARMLTDVVRWSKFGFVVMFSTGGVLFATQASKAYGNVFFRTKLLLLFVLGVNAAVYQFVLYPRLANWGDRGASPVAARICGGVSLIGWIAVIVCGRTMAYQF
jgi:hypothetical protein